MEPPRCVRPRRPPERPQVAHDCKWGDAACSWGPLCCTPGAGGPVYASELGTVPGRGCEFTKREAECVEQLVRNSQPSWCSGGWNRGQSPALMSPESRGSDREREEGKRLSEGRPGTRSQASSSEVTLARAHRVPGIGVVLAACCLSPGGRSEQRPAALVARDAQGPPEEQGHWRPRDRGVGCSPGVAMCPGWPVGCGQAAWQAAGDFWRRKGGSPCVVSRFGCNLPSSRPPWALWGGQAPPRWVGPTLYPSPALCCQALLTDVWWKNSHLIEAGKNGEAGGQTSVSQAGEAHGSWFMAPAALAESCLSCPGCTVGSHAALVPALWQLVTGQVS